MMRLARVVSMEKKNNIGNLEAGLMMAFALCLDGLQFLADLTVILLPLSILVTLLAFGFPIWFFLHGAYHGRTAGLKLLASFGTIGLELIPVVNALPLIAGGVLLNIVLSRIEDLKKRVGTDPKKVAALARLQRMKAAQARRRATMAEEREATQGARHGAGTEPPEE